MTKILYASASPYSAKVRMSATYAGVAYESVKTDTNTPSEEFLKAKKPKEATAQAA